MARYVAPDKGVKETVIGNKTYRPDKGGIYNVESASNERIKLKRTKVFTAKNFKFEWK